MRLCPYCAKSISDQDSMCPHCRETIIAPATSAALPQALLVVEAAPQPAAPKSEIPPEIKKLKLAMKRYFDAGYEKVHLSRDGAEMVKPKPPLDIAGVILFMIFPPIAIALVVEHLVKKDKRAFFDLLENGTVDITGDTLEVAQQAKGQLTVGKCVFLFIALTLVCLLTWFILQSQQMRAQLR